ncbi:Gti1/Pac2 family-domain-containing protein [Mycena polygramma]|nr:Gti1/Pac2 family-domain-containing protein [Mycena polygramma]
MSSSQPTDILPFSGAVETTMNALRLIHAARLGVIPRITRRLNDAERRTMIKSGAVFVFSVEESGIKRWTDGLPWSPSRIVGNFLVYREINERTNSRGSHKKLYPTDQQSQALHVGPSSLVRLHNALAAIAGHQSSEHETFKPNGLIKKTITVTIEGSDLHLISYYTSADQHSGKLKTPTSRSDIMNLPMDPHLFRSTNFRVPPEVEQAPDGTLRLVETEEVVSDIVEGKIEDEPYSVSVSPISRGSDSSSQGSPVESPFAGTALYPVSSHSASVYPSVGHGERWSVPVPALRPEAWSSHSSHHYASSRRDTAHSDSWNLSSARWQGDTYLASTSPTSSVYVDRSRTRSTNPYPAPLQIPSHRRDSETPTVLNSRCVGHHSGETRESSRLPWLLAGETDTKQGIRQSSGTPFTPTSTQPSIYSPQGYHRPMNSHASCNCGWSSNSSSSLSMSSAPFSPASGMQSYSSSYAPSSGGMSSPEEYSNTDEYGES